jgi:phenylalanyl-tRNA synthetase beta chain
MKVPLSWLRDYVDFDLPPERLAERLTLLGMEVGAIEKIGDDWTSVVIGELLEVGPHPNADRIQLTKVRVSDTDAPLQIVCGAHNIAAGQRVPVALPGAVLPGDRRIGVSTIQGTESQGMLCSGAELGLSADSDGILILDGMNTHLGQPVADVVGDVVLDIDVKPNRGDALSMIGLAREVAAISGTKVRWPRIEVPETGDSTDDHVWVEVADKRLCTRFVARYVDGLKIGPSPVRIQLRLQAAGMRPVSNAVDASNYVMLEMGKPIHVFDAASVSGGTIVVRPAHDGEQLETLDHVQRSLTPDTLVIADSGGPIGIAGVMGGAGSEVSESTTAAIVESAIFDPVSIRRTAFRYALRSEASLRFEKGQEFRLARIGADRTTQLLAEWAGGRAALGAVDTNPTEEQPKRVSFRPARVNRLVGSGYLPEDMTDALAAVEIATVPSSDDPDSLVALVPTHRRDIEIEEDVAEEIARVIGYDMLPPRLPNSVMPHYRPDPRRFEDSLRDALAGRGLNEIVTHGLIAPVDHERLGYAADDSATIRVSNPVAADHAELRRSLLPGLLEALARNERQRRPDMSAFEIGAVHEWTGSEPRESDWLGIILAGNTRTQSFVEPARAASVEDVKGLIEAIAARFNLGRVSYRVTQPRAGVEHPGRTGEAMLENAAGAISIGRVGEVHPNLLAGYEVKAEHVVFAEIDMASLRAAFDAAPEVRDVESLPLIERDLAVIVSRDTEAHSVEEVIRTNAGPYLARLELFDRYQGPPLEPGEVSLAYRLRFQPADPQLSEQSIESSVDAVTKALARDVNGRLRSGS